MLRVLTEHWQLKLLALALAVGLWFFVGSAERTEIALAVPVEYVGLEGLLTLDGSRREMVDVQLQATRWAAARLNAGSLRVRVDVSGLREGDNVVHLTPESVEVPAGVRVIRVAPAWSTVRTVRAATRTVRVVPQVHGRPAADHILGPVLVDPATVEIKGPRTTIEGRSAVETLPVDVSGRRAPVTQTVGLALPDSVYLVDRRTVSVTVEIRPQ
ncbi:MAG TPA: CdaR family protein [Methylomirabilota bacterium]|nr:CdaR family protein [Methylomirabilota bacterium]